MYSQAEYSVFSPRIHYNQQVDTTKNNITMKLTFVLRNKQNALKLSTKTLNSFIERIKTDTKDGAAAVTLTDIVNLCHMIQMVISLL